MLSKEKMLERNQPRGQIKKILQQELLSKTDHREKTQSKLNPDSLKKGTIKLVNTWNKLINSRETVVSLNEFVMDLFNLSPGFLDGSIELMKAFKNSIEEDVSLVFGKLLMLASFGETSPQVNFKNKVIMLDINQLVSEANRVHTVSTKGLVRNPNVKKRLSEIGLQLSEDGNQFVVLDSSNTEIMRFDKNYIAPVTKESMVNQLNQIFAFLL